MQMTVRWFGREDAIGAMGGVAFQRITGRVLQANGNDYTPIFLAGGLACVTAWVIIHLLGPRLEPVALDG